MRPIAVSDAARWEKDFDRLTENASIRRRFTLEDRDVILGRRKTDRLFLMEKKKRRFALLPPVLCARIRPGKDGKPELRARFFRPAFPGIVLLIWAGMMMGTGLCFAGREWQTFFTFFSPGALGILPFVWYNQKKKKKLLAVLHSIFASGGPKWRG